MALKTELRFKRIKDVVYVDLRSLIDALKTVDDNNVSIKDIEKVYLNAINHFKHDKN